MMTIRKTLKQQRKHLSWEQQAQWSQMITHQVIHHANFQQAMHIACYLPIMGEVHTQGMIDAIWAQGKQCYLPIVTKQELQFVHYTPETPLIKGDFGFQQPATSETIILSEALDLVITPLVAFDENCHRLGMGAGHYDRTFAFLNISPRPEKPFMLGVAYELQKLSCITQESWDVSLNAIITEAQCFSC